MVSPMRFSISASKPAASFSIAASSVILLSTASHSQVRPRKRSSPGGPKRNRMCSASRASDPALKIGVRPTSSLIM